MTEPTCYIEREQKKHDESSLYTALMAFPVPVAMYMIMSSGIDVFRKHLYGKPMFEMGLFALLCYSAVTAMVGMIFIYDYFLDTETVKVPVKHSEVQQNKDEM